MSASDLAVSMVIEPTTDKLEVVDVSPSRSEEALKDGSDDVPGLFDGQNIS